MDKHAKRHDEHEHESQPHSPAIFVQNDDLCNNNSNNNRHNDNGSNTNGSEMDGNSKLEGRMGSNSVVASVLPVRCSMERSRSAQIVAQSDSTSNVNANSNANSYTYSQTQMLLAQPDIICKLRAAEGQNAGSYTSLSVNAGSVFGDCESVAYLSCETSPVRSRNCRRDTHRIAFADDTVPMQTRSYDLQMSLSLYASCPALFVRLTTASACGATATSTASNMNTNTSTNAGAGAGAGSGSTATIGSSKLNYLRRATKNEQARRLHARGGKTQLQRQTSGSEQALNIRQMKQKDSANVRVPSINNNSVNANSLGKLMPTSRNTLSDIRMPVCSSTFSEGNLAAQCFNN